MANANKKNGCEIRKCDCKNSYQDSKFGEGKRV